MPLALGELKFPLLSRKVSEFIEAVYGGGGGGGGGGWEHAIDIYHSLSRYNCLLQHQKEKRGVGIPGEFNLVVIEGAGNGSHASSETFADRVAISNCRVSVEPLGSKILAFMHV